MGSAALPSPAAASRLSAAILMGGESRRMGRDKAWLDLDGRPLVLRLAAQLAAFSDDVFLVAAHQPAPAADASAAAHGLRVVYDPPTPGGGPLRGLAAALAHARHPAVLVLACDLPDVPDSLLAALAAADPAAWCAVPRLSSGLLEPLCARYAVSLLPEVDRRLSIGERGLHPLIQASATVWVEFECPGGLANLNTPADFAAWTAGRHRGT